MLTALHADLRDAGIELRLSQVRGSVRDRMRRTGLMATIGEDHCFLSDEAAVAAPLPIPAVGPARRTKRSPPTSRRRTRRRPDRVQVVSSDASMTTATGWSKARDGFPRSLVPTAMPAATTMPTTARPRTMT